MLWLAEEEINGIWAELSLKLPFHAHNAKKSKGPSFGGSFYRELLV